MIYCGRHDGWVETALEYLPDAIYEAIQDIVAITVLESDACRLAEKIGNKEEIIILSPWIFSYIPPGSCEADPEWRYFVFSVLHEIAHVALKHDPPDELDPQAIATQEEQADLYALEWFNSHVSEYKSESLGFISIEEVRAVQKRYQKKLEPILAPG